MPWLAAPLAFFVFSIACGTYADRVSDWPAK
jgi:hypothetical protein